MIRVLRWQGGRSGYLSATTDNTIVAQFSLSARSMNVLGQLMACEPPSTGDPGAWAKQQILNYLNSQYPNDTWQ